MDYEEWCVQGVQTEVQRLAETPKVPLRKELPEDSALCDKTKRSACAVHGDGCIWGKLRPGKMKCLGHMPVGVSLELEVYSFYLIKKVKCKIPSSMSFRRYSRRHGCHEMTAPCLLLSLSPSSGAGFGGKDGDTDDPLSVQSWANGFKVETECFRRISCRSWRVNWMMWEVHCLTFTSLQHGTVHTWLLALKWELQHQHSWFSGLQNKTELYHWLSWRSSLQTTGCNK
uniref:uncharacterized protein LOC118151574 n=1 Tax=Callithrix jacchus TaxID=9483 RepID=UPI00159E9791|nr:uncharacterized protein LOC118151574 [Callithrix jacchus]